MAACYKKNIGILPNDKNIEIAWHWLLKAANSGHQTAQFDIGLASEKGEKIGKSEAAALAWFEASANLNHGPAQNKVGEYHELGVVLLQIQSKPFIISLKQ